ncbi:hypothetical protein P152DRAFT_470570 [Eremomyces bilateralis CBS 781.70]|uniref:BZIP domain-containing protein n=1 Tax=Eremomyces bilateralis CBS 781.70 TaxID=1392243 RepID=A0A6G1GET1_9PEZI|nr:uncharacterized protein P152DRAFT_470570 [Eremomyces bilateralis CBS 781.70]KAF1816563.1 hypothetical protein P152DRAFT_470570 [Eremomyces bilateralis CBS 781.70]
MSDSRSLDDLAAAPAVGREEHLRDVSTDSLQSTPEPEPEASQEHNLQQPKRKGGRKPIYATSEERKQRNRQAQAAFRERRTEYIKQLEATIKQHEETLQTLQANHRNAADECLMLRYKNSLLERILLEKGIDVQAELHAKGGSPQLGATRTTTAPTPISNQARFSFPRAATNPARRSVGAIPGNPDGAHPLQNRSPHLQPTPTSQSSSPPTTSTRSPNFLPQPNSNMSPSFNAVPGATGQPIRPQQPPPLRPQGNPRQSPGRLVTSYPNSGAAQNGPRSAPHQFYPSPFQNHIDQLEQEYDAEADMVDEPSPSDPPTARSPYPHNYYNPASQMQSMPPPPAVASQGPNQPFPPPTAAPPQPPQPQQRRPPPQGESGMSGANRLFDPYDPILDADPFGLSASMQFPTQFTYETR